MRPGIIAVALAAWLLMAATASASTVAFVRGTNLSPVTVWVSANGAAPTELGQGNGPLVAPNGQSVAASSEDGGALLVFPAAGGTPYKFTPHSAEVHPLAWSPDSRYLAFQLYGNATRGLGNSGIDVLDTSTGKVRMLKKTVVNGASFAPDSSDRVVFGAAPSLDLKAPVNLFTASAAGGPITQITHDGASLNPAWGSQGIAYDHQEMRSEAPEWQVMLRTGDKVRQLTHLKVSALQQGLAPMAFSSDGNHLWCEYEGEDTDYAETIQLQPLRVRAVRVGNLYVQGGGISPDGNTVIVATGAFMDPPSDGTIRTVPFSGGAATPLFRGAQPSWNG